MNSLNLFSTPIYFNNIRIQKQDKNILLDENYERFEINNGFVTSNKYVLENKKLDFLKKEIIANLSIYLYQILKIKKNIKFEMLNSWCTKHSLNDWSQPHHHENSLISGVLYLRTFKNSGNLAFYRNGIPNIFPNCIKIEFEEHNINNSETFLVNPQDGDLILFPSHLEHAVTKNLNNKDRYCCAFNFFAKGKLGTDKNSNYMEIK